MTKIISKRLPHGSVPSQGVKDGAVRNAVMGLNENILALQEQVRELQSAVTELQRKKV